MNKVKTILSPLFAHLGRHIILGAYVGVGIGIIDLAILLISTNEGVGILDSYKGMTTLVAVVNVLFGAVWWCTAIFLLQGFIKATWDFMARQSKWLTWLFVALCSIPFSYRWHLSILRGDGITTHPHYLLIKYALWIILFMCLTVTNVWGVTDRSKLHRYMWPLYALFGLSIGLFLLPLYSEFHAYLITYSVWCLGVFLWSDKVRKKSRFLLESTGLKYCLSRRWFLIEGILVCSLLVFWASQIIWSKAGVMQLQDDLVLSRYVSIHEPFGFVRDPDRFERRTMSKLQRERAKALIEEHQNLHGIQGNEHIKQDRDKAKNVVVLVLESIHAESWNNPKIAPEFSTWKKQGTYFPKAIAHYPATPLAYGAMFLSQTPYVIIHSPYWGKSTPLNHLKRTGILNNFYLSRPNNHWFNQSTITSFLLGSPTNSSTHKSTASGLQQLRIELEKNRKDKDSRMFAWLHVYDAHAPYKLHKNLRAPKKGESSKLSAYLSELTYVDHEIGGFMKWYFSSPVSNDTLLIVIADHGEGIGKPIMGKSFWGHHVHVHKEVSHVPMFIAGPGVARGREIEQSIAAQIDLIPTMFDGIGAALPEKFMAQGRSLYPIIGQHVSDEHWKQNEAHTYSIEAFSIRGQQFFDFVSNTTKKDRNKSDVLLQELAVQKNDYSPKVALQRGDLKLVYNRASHRTILYNLKEDPNERFDVSQIFAESFHRMMKELEMWHHQQKVIIDTLNTPHSPVNSK